MGRSPLKDFFANGLVCFRKRTGQCFVTYSASALGEFRQNPYYVVISVTVKCVSSYIG